MDPQDTFADGQETFADVRERIARLKTTIKQRKRTEIPKVVSPVHVPVLEEEETEAKEEAPEAPPAGKKTLNDLIVSMKYEQSLSNLLELRYFLQQSAHHVQQFCDVGGCTLLSASLLGDEASSIAAAVVQCFGLIAAVDVNLLGVDTFPALIAVFRRFAQAPEVPRTILVVLSLLIAEIVRCPSGEGPAFQSVQEILPLLFDLLKRSKACSPLQSDVLLCFTAITQRWSSLTDRVLIQSKMLQHSGIALLQAKSREIGEFAQAETAAGNALSETVAICIRQFRALLEGFQADMRLLCSSLLKPIEDAQSAIQ